MKAAAQLRAALLLARATLAALLAWPLTPARAADEAMPAPTQAGPFTIEPVRDTARGFDANHGFTRHTYFEFRVRHGGRVLKLPTADGKSEREHREAWVLAGASRPALLVGGGPWWLLTEEAGRPQLRRVAEGDSGGTVQWLDAAGGAGPRFTSRMRDNADDSRVLQGGRRLLLNQNVVLDVQTLQAQPLTLDPPADYHWAGINPLGLAPDGSAMALMYRGPRSTARDALLIVPATTRAGRQLLPVDLRATGGLHDPAHATPEWLARHFEWTPHADGAMRLRPLTAGAAPWQARYELGLGAPMGPRGPVARYQIAPVRAGLLAALREAATTVCCMKPDPANPGSAHEVHLLAWIVQVRLRFDAAQQALVVESDDPQEWLRAQIAVEELGELVDAKLAAGKWREHIATAHRRGP